MPHRDRHQDVEFSAKAVKALAAVRAVLEELLRLGPDVGRAIDWTMLGVFDPEGKGIGPIWPRFAEGTKEKSTVKMTNWEILSLCRCILGLHQSLPYLMRLPGLPMIADDIQMLAEALERILDGIPGDDIKATLP